MRKLLVVAAVVSIAGWIAGCSTASKDVPTQYISPLAYRDYDCQQIGAEALRLQGRIAQIGGRLDAAAANDQAIGVGAVLFWPALFALGGTKQQEAEYGNLKGQADALQQAAIGKKCGLVANAAPVPAAAAAQPQEPAKP